jgi:hypothetical protein
MKVVSSYEISPSLIASDIASQCDINAFHSLILYINVELDIPSCLNALNITVPYIGCTVLAAFAGKSSMEASIIIIGLAESANPVCGHLEEVATKYPDKKLIALSVMDNELHRLSERFTFSGGIAADNMTFDRAQIFINGVTLNAGTVAVAFDAHACSKATCGWQPILASRGTVTKADDQKVYSINGKPVIEYYKDFIPSPSLFAAYPLYLPHRDIYRAALKVNEADGSIAFSTPIAVGEDVFITLARRNTLKEHTNALLRDPIMTQQTCDLSLLVCCAARSLMMADVSTYEHDELHAQHDNPVTVYLYGEFIPGDSTTQLQNQHAVITKYKRHT